MTLARHLAVVLSAAVLFTAASASAQTPPPPPAYGTPINLEQAKKAIAAAEAEARKNNWPVVIAILDTGGLLVMLQRLDNTQWGSIEVAKHNVPSAVGLRPHTKAFSDAIAQGGANMRLLNLTGASVIEGGVPVIVDGKIIGAIGVSGVTSQQDAQVAQAGADAVK